MELTRRHFVSRLTAGMGAVLAGAWCAVKTTGVARAVQAVRASVFPGRVRPLDPEEIKKPGRWAG